MFVRDTASNTYIDCLYIHFSVLARRMLLRAGVRSLARDPSERVYARITFYSQTTDFTAMQHRSPPPEPHNDRRDQQQARCQALPQQDRRAYLEHPNTNAGQEFCHTQDTSALQPLA